MFSTQQLENCTGISGAWSLDLSRSNTMAGHLRVVGLSTSNILAHVAAEHRYGGGLNLIQLDASTITIHKRTYTTDYTETLEIGVETDTNRNKMHFPRFETVTIPHTGPPGYSCFIRITSSCGDDLQLVDTRTVSSGGLSHIQELHAVNVTTWEEIKTTRVWVRVPMTCEHYTTLAQTPVARRQSSS